MFAEKGYCFDYFDTFEKIKETFLTSREDLFVYPQKLRYFLTKIANMLKKFGKQVNAII